ncbi:hypothetical protein ABZ370_33145 [Streptomyces sp. NPDC005962]|uniref:hypothetical protein n=1 Tax=Streptomyces sp. NPDC005962 TaxID=3154466 RepID=UPI00340A3D3A
MTDIATVKLHVQGKPEITYRARRIITPEIITFIYLLDAPEPVNGIYPARAEVYGPCRLVRPGKFSFNNPRANTQWFYQGWPEDWPAWLIDLGAEHRPHRP